jgi:hypothetical protein
MASEKSGEQKQLSGPINCQYVPNQMPSSQTGNRPLGCQRRQTDSARRRQALRKMKMLHLSGEDRYGQDHTARARAYERSRHLASSLALASYFGEDIRLNQAIGQGRIHRG